MPRTREGGAVVASEVARTGDTIVFLASRFLVEGQEEGWSDPVQFRFEQEDRGAWNLVMRRLDA